MAFAKGTGTVTGVQAATTAIRDFLVNTVGWRSEGSGALDGRTYYGVGSPGEAGTKTMHLGLYPRRETSVKASIQVWPARSYNAACAFNTQPDGPQDGTCGIAWCALRKGYFSIPSIPCTGDGTITWWCYADKDTVVVILKSDTYYHAGYFGLLESYGHPECDLHPMVALGGQCFNLTELCYNCARYWPFGQNGNQASPNSWVRGVERVWFQCPPSPVWHCGDGCCWRGVNGVTRLTTTLCNTLIMGVHFNAPNNPWGMGGGRTLTPIMVGMQQQETRGMRGAMRHVFHVSNVGLAAEAVITVGGNDYRVFPPVTVDGTGGVIDTGRWIAVRNYT